jgi:acetyl-CoA synthetase
MAETDIKWFSNAKVNITKNCIDRHLAKKVIKQLSFLNDPSEAFAHFYNELHKSG